MSARWWLLALAALAFVAPVRGEEKRGLTITFIDTEGGAATLIVTPAKESILIDCGNPGSRDAGRIHEAAKQAGLEAIDHLIITHWHLDHYGSVEDLVKLIPIRNFHDRGIPDMLVEDPKQFPLLIAAYKKATGGKSKTLRAGDSLPLRSTAGSPDLRLDCLCASGEVIPGRAGAAENEAAKENTPMPVDITDNAKSLGFLLRFGGFRFLDLGDLTWNVEHKLVWPSDKIGLVDVYQTTHHGLEISNNPAVIRTVRPRVAIFNNGARKGCHPTVVANLRRVPDLQAIYQMHRNLTATAAENTDPELIANAEETCRGEAIYLSVAPDGRSYTVRVGSEGKPRSYKTRLEK
jgi:beta-lactamase superfamily II metal-dependent hydrolase